MNMKRNDMNAQKPSSKTKLAGIAILMATLGGCSFGKSMPTVNGPDEGLPHYQRNPIILSNQNEDVIVVAPPHRFAIFEDDKDRVAEHVAAYKANGHGNLMILAPVNSPNEAASITAASQITQVMMRHGIDPRTIKVSGYQASPDDPNAPIYVRYNRYRATTRPCGDWSRTLTYDPNNTAYPNLGCSTQSNLAAMAADPRDLKGPRALDPSDPSRRGAVLEKYRDGAATNSAKTGDDSGLVSDAVGDK